MQYENTVTIGRSPDDVFEYLSAIETTPMWHSEGLDVRPAGSGPLGVGSMLNIKAQVMGQTVNSTGTITIWDPPRTIRIEAPGGVSIAVQFNLTPNGHGTHLQALTDVTAGGLMKMMAGMAGSILQRQGQAGLEDVKTILESQKPG